MDESGLNCSEPTDEEHVRLVDYYDRIEKEIRDVDPDHIVSKSLDLIMCIFHQSCSLALPRRQHVRSRLFGFQDLSS
jgi:hypothetical protein